MKEPWGYKVISPGRHARPLVRDGAGYRKGSVVFLVISVIAGLLLFLAIALSVGGADE